MIMLHILVFINHLKLFTNNTLVIARTDILTNNVGTIHFRGGPRRLDRPHPMHYPIDLSSRNVTHTEEINLLSKGPSFCPIPRDINWHKCRLDWQAFVDKVRWADFYFDREPTHN